MSNRPGSSHSLVGLFTTLVNVFLAQKGHFSLTAKISTITISIYGGCMFLLYTMYSRMLDKIMTPHDKEIVRGERS